MRKFAAYNTYVASQIHSKLLKCDTTVTGEENVDFLVAINALKIKTTQLYAFIEIDMPSIEPDFYQKIKSLACLECAYFDITSLNESNSNVRRCNDQCLSLFDSISTNLPKNEKNSVFIHAKRNVDQNEFEDASEKAIITMNTHLHKLRRNNHIRDSFHNPFTSSDYDNLNYYIDNNSLVLRSIQMEHIFIVDILGTLDYALKDIKRIGELELEGNDNILHLIAPTEEILCQYKSELEFNNETQNYFYSSLTEDQKLKNEAVFDALCCKVRRNGNNTTKRYYIEVERLLHESRKKNEFELDRKHYTMNSDDLIEHKKSRNVHDVHAIQNIRRNTRQKDHIRHSRALTGCDVCDGVCEEIHIHRDDVSSHRSSCKGGFNV